MLWRNQGLTYEHDPYSTKSKYLPRNAPCAMEVMVLREIERAWHKIISCNGERGSITNSPCTHKSDIRYYIQIPTKRKQNFFQYYL